MTRTGMIVLGICGMFLGWTLIAVLLLLYGNEWWLSGLTTLTVFAWLAGLLVVLFQQGRIRTIAIGAVIAAAAYWLVVLGPWFASNVGPTLLTSRLLAKADTMLHGSPQQVQTLAWSAPQPYPAQNIYMTGSGIAAPGTIQTTLVPQTTLAFVNTTVSQGNPVFQACGHWLTIWLCAAIGGSAALVMKLRSDKEAASG